MNILITGASGFIGSFLVEKGIAEGHTVWAGIRTTSSLRYLQDSRIRHIELDFNNPAHLHKQLAHHQEEYGKWDCIIHAAGATKCRKPSDFFRTNTDGTRHFADALCALNMIPFQFIFISSLSIYGPIRETRVAPHAGSVQPHFAIKETRATGTPLRTSVYAPIQEQDSPQPNTAYGASKYAAEKYLKSIKNFPLVIFRPTGVYGPRERDYFLMAKSIAGHIDFAAGFKPQELTFVYVKDLVEAVFLAIKRQITGREYFISDGQSYNSRAFSDLLQKEMGVSRVLHLKAPLWFLRSVCTVSGKWAQLTGKTSTLNTDKYNIMKQRNWQCDIQPLIAELGYRPEYDLRRGVAETVAWYKKEKWL